MCAHACVLCVLSAHTCAHLCAWQCVCAWPGLWGAVCTLPGATHRQTGAVRRGGLAPVCPEVLGSLSPQTTSRGAGAPGQGQAGGLGTRPCARGGRRAEGPARDRQPGAGQTETPPWGPGPPHGLSCPQGWWADGRAGAGPRKAGLLCLSQSRAFSRTRAGRTALPFIVVPRGPVLTERSCCWREEGGGLGPGSRGSAAARPGPGTGRGARLAPRTHRPLWTDRRMNGRTRQERP